MESKNQKTRLPEPPPGFFRCEHYRALLFKIRCVKRREMARVGYWSGHAQALQLSFAFCRDCGQGDKIEISSRTRKNKIPADAGKRGEENQPGKARKK